MDSRVENPSQPVSVVNTSPATYDTTLQLKTNNPYIGNNLLPIPASDGYYGTNVTSVPTGFLPYGTRNDGNLLRPVPLYNTQTSPVHAQPAPYGVNHYGNNRSQVLPYGNVSTLLTGNYEYRPNYSNWYPTFRPEKETLNWKETVPWVGPVQGHDQHQGQDDSTSPAAPDSKRTDTDPGSHPGLIAPDVGVAKANQSDVSVAPASCNKPNDYIELSVVSCVFNCIFSLVAISLSFRSRDAWQKGNRKKAKMYGAWALAVSLFGILTSLLFVFMMCWFKLR